MLFDWYVCQPLIIFIYGENYLNIITLMRILLVASFFNCGLRYTTANILAAMGQVKYNMFVSLFGMIAQVFINIMIIPLYGVIGLAITSCIVYAGMALVLFYLFIKNIINLKIRKTILMHNLCITCKI